ncbi:MAG: PAS domain S-box protein [Lutibacter sp.]|nr:PAS domain S-box protein [Lutibacter sp.]
MKEGDRTTSMFIESANQIKSLERELKNFSKEDEKHKTFFENAPISLWIEDFSEVKKYLEKQAKENNTDVISFINDNPSIISKIAHLVEIKEVNTATLKLYKAKTKHELFANLDSTFTEDSNKGFAKFVVELFKGKKEYELETVNKTLEGDAFDILLKFRIAEGSEKTFKNIIVSIENISSRKKAERLLFESNQRLKDQFNNTPLASIIFDLDFKILEWNNSAQRIFGYTAEDVIGVKSEDLLTPPHLFSKMKDIRKSFFNKYDSIKNTNENITKSGDIITCDWYTVLLRNDQNEIIGRACLVDDITERINTKKILEKSEKKYRNIFEKSRDAILILKENVFVDCNKAALELFEYANKNEFLQVHPSQISPKIQSDGTNSYNKAEEMMNAALKEDYNRFIWDHKKKNGTIFPTEVTLTRIDEYDDKPTIHTVIKDITDKIKNEALEDVLYNISKAALTIRDFRKFGYFIKKELQKIIDTNNFFIALYNEENNTITTPIFVDEKEEFSEIEEFSAKDSLTGYVIKTKKSLLIGKEELYKLVNKGVINIVGIPSEKWLGVPLIIKDKVVGAIVVQSYTNENAYNKNDVNLLEFVADQISTTILRKKTDEDLKKALIKAEESDQLKSAFLANMSHEIRTPMNGIIGFSEFFLEPNLSEVERKKYAKIVINSGKRLLSIVNDILDISKIEAGEVKLNYETVKLNSLLEELFVFYNPIAQKNNLELKYVKGLDNFKSIIEIDKTKLNQILSNFLSNAFKFTEEGTIEFGYELNEDKLQFYVKDTGIGIEKKLQDQIFDRFTQANIDLVKKHKGTGLGLAISKKLIELFKGEIWLNSDNNGTAIYFTIPYIKSKTLQITSVVRDNKRDTQVKNKEITILVAEDEEYNMMYINELFSKTNFKIIEADNGKKAVELSQKYPEIDLVLMDIKMPIMNGNTAMKEIKKLQPNLPIIALSAFAMDSDKKRFLEEGFNDFLSKPINKKLLFGVIDKFS